MSRAGRRVRAHGASTALTPDGSILLNVAAEHPDADLVELVRAAIAGGERVFIGVELARDETARVPRALVEAADEAGAFVLGRRMRNARRGAR